ncbi:hypothetical protein DCBHLPFO_00734 [Mycoplasmopsis arginini]|uniref:Uncharacterized protein n=1 Tax=Mycoplasmopsis arginini TaxID=2094 RepID=A0AA43QX47_MYCAR|nr:hypothetical protein [Mycoplasmopsis arginini]
MLPTEYLNYNDKLYWVYRKVRQSRIKEEHINDVRDLWHCDMVLRTKNSEETYLIFIREIQDVTYDEI